jgi:predicted RNA binding protein YcfA (HicA-like mRNA interferase family)
VADYDRLVEGILKDAGCYIVRQGKGSHTIWFSPITLQTVSVPQGTKSKHTVNKVLKDAGLPKHF